MLYFVWGTDREATRIKVATIKSERNQKIFTVTDTQTLPDLEMALASGGLFAEEKTVVCDGVCVVPEMKSALLGALPRLKKAKDLIIIREEKIEADTRKQIEKYAEESFKFELTKEKAETTIFALANALQKRDKKSLWVGLQREFLAGNAPEAVHGVLFWGAKQAHLRAPTASTSKLIARLAELPHEARRKGVELDCALERFALSEV